MKIRKLIAYFFATLLLICIVPSLTVFAADDDFSVTYEIDPEVLGPSGGYITLTLHVTNIKADTIAGNDLEVYTTTPYFESWKTNIEIGETVTTSFTIPIASTDLDKEINVVLHMENDEIPGSDGIQTFSFIVESSDEEPCGEERTRNQYRWRYGW